jgi:hypothetical protein
MLNLVIAKLAHTMEPWMPGPEEHQTKEELLEVISLDNGAIAVTREGAEENGLGLTSVFPWDESKRLYFIHAYHGLHCIVSLL